MAIVAFRYTHNHSKTATTLSAAIERGYEERWKSKKDGAKTRSRLIQIVEFMGDVELDDIDEVLINAFKGHLSQKGLSNSTINRHIANLKTLLRMAWREWKLISSVPYIKLEKENKHRMRVISQREEQEILRLLRITKVRSDSKFKDIADLVEVLIDTGMRVGESLKMTYADNINLDEWVINLYPDDTKPGEPRCVPMTKRIHRILTTRQHTHPDRPFPYINEYVSQVFRWLRNQMGLEHDKQFVPHSLRHTCASRLVRKGIRLRVVKELLGHSTILVTEKYAHLDTETLEDAIKVLEED